MFTFRACSISFFIVITGDGRSDGEVCCQVWRVCQRSRPANGVQIGGDNSAALVTRPP